ncbi:MAG TPA: hypothetical protein VJA21_07750 [Verrucomicrobiae bacterium]
MKDLFQRRKSGANSAATDPAQARLTLAAFGKHPGWDDHILGIGAETETLALAKQALYVSGIGGQIDSGAWEKLDPEKRLPGYDHTFLWLRPGHLVLGQLWSSTDGKGRAKYPMVLCIDGEGLWPGFMLAYLLPGLDRLQEACRATTSAEQVRSDCRAAQDQLRALLTSGDSRLVETTLGREAKQRFLERPELGPDRLGFLRALHELGAATTARSRHVRLPLASDSLTEALALWGAFLRCVVPDNVPLLLLSRRGVDWLDVVIGEPATDDLFCLQASAKATPRATEIPYDLAPDSRDRMQKVEARFLGIAPPTTTVAPPPPAPKTQPVSPPAKPADSAPAAPPGKWFSTVFVIGGIILLAAVAGVWLSGGGRKGPTPPEPLAANATNQPAREPIASTQSNPPPQQTEIEQRYLVAFNEAQAAFGRKDYATALAKAEIALALRPTDPAANKLRNDARQQINVAVAAREQEQKYQAALNEARGAFDRKDYTNAMAKADLALTLKPNDPAAAKLRAEAQQQIAQAASAIEREQNYQAALSEGRGAFDRKDYTNAMAKADLALTFKPNDPAANMLKNDAQQQINVAVAVRERDQKYQAALSEGQGAFDRKDYTNAMAKADLALTFKPNDPAANKLKDDAQQQINLAVAAKEQEKLKEDLQTAREFLDQGNYDEVLKRCTSRPGVAAFDSLKETASLEQSTLKDVISRFNAGDYTFIDSLKGQSYSAKPPFADLLSKAAEEKQILGELEALKEANKPDEVKTRFAGLTSASFVGKAPFVDLRKWAETPPAAPAVGDTQKQVFQDLESRLEVLMVRFNLLDPMEAMSPRARAEHAIMGSLGPDANASYIAMVQDLRARFKKGGWLTPAREKDLNRLEKTISYHP